MEYAIKSMNKRIKMGQIGIAAEMLKLLGQNGKTKLQKILNRVL